MQDGRLAAGPHYKTGKAVALQHWDSGQHMPSCQNVCALDQQLSSSWWEREGGEETGEREEGVGSADADHRKCQRIGWRRLVDQVAAAIRRGTAVDDTSLSSHKTLDSGTLSSLIPSANIGQSGNEDAMTMPTLSRL
ncbi:hypothetical protein BaRGS_00003907 [Batillaria attramentaria]|uniref:Uncharacterized protein n=1 Tax=Batillaria attramentaria TaxID=370345 RepID=A0ABD0M0P8_9CAEN